MIKVAGGCKGTAGSSGTGWSIRSARSECNCSSVVDQRVISAAQGIAYRRKLAFALECWRQAILTTIPESLKEGIQQKCLVLKEKVLK